jgi:pimeloyl-ACP methyl ester carboxylesterase
MKAIKWVLFLLVVMGIAGAGLFYLRPVLFDLQMKRATLFANHIHSEYVATPEGRIHYFEGEPPVPGGGVPLVLVHGLGDRGEAWTPMMVALKKAGFHVYALDLLGYGRSPKPGDSDYSITEQEQLVVHFIQALGLQKPNIAGWSMGGWVTLKLAIQYPDLVDRVVVYDSAGIQFAREYPDSVFHVTNEQELARLAHLLEPNGKPLPHFVAKDALRKFAEEQWVIDRSIASMVSAKDALDDHMYQLKNPLLIVWGSDDKLLPLSTVGEKFHALDPLSDLDVIQGCGHLVPAGCTDRAAKATVDFLRANPVPQGEWDEVQEAGNRK